MAYCDKQLAVYNGILLSRIKRIPRLYLFVLVVLSFGIKQTSHSQTLSPPSTTIVEIQKGDTLSSIILKHYGVTYNNPIKYQALQDSILRLNGYKDPDKIHAGNLVLPIEPSQERNPHNEGSAALASPLSITSAEKAIIATTQPPDTFDTNLAIVQLNLDSLYVGTEEKAELIKELDAFLPHRIVTVNNGDSVSALIARTYRVGTSTPEAQTMLASEILKLNNLSKATDLQVGTCLVPTLPPRAPNQNSMFTQPAFVNYSDLVPLSHVQEASLFIKKHAKKGRRYSYRQTAVQNVLSSYAYPRSEPYSELQTPDLTTTLRLKIPRSLLDHIDNYPMVKKLLQAIGGEPVAIALAGTVSPQSPVSVSSEAFTGASTTNEAVLTESECAYLSGTLKTHVPHRTTFLYIQDTGWPTAEAMTNCYKHLFPIMDSFWKACSNLSKYPYPRTIPSFSPPSNRHCSEINESLTILNKLDSNSSVNVIFIPLIKDQNAKLLLTELINIFLLLTKPHNSTPSVFDAKDLATERRNAEGIVSSEIPSTWDSNQVYTDVGAILGPLELVHWYGIQTGTKSFLNQSWTAPHREYYGAIPSPATCVIVAAAGNGGPHLNIFDDTNLPDFVERSLGHDDTIGVLNVHRTFGIDPTSSIVGGEGVQDASVVGFDGNIDEGTGTSFSAPRIAWMLCAAESVRNKPCEQKAWLLHQKILLQESRNPIGAANQFWLDPIKLMKNAVNY